MSFKPKHNLDLKHLQSLRWILRQMLRSIRRPKLRLKLFVSIFLVLFIETSYGTTTSLFNPYLDNEEFSKNKIETLEDFNKAPQWIEEKQKKEGLAYIISGSILLTASTIGFIQSENQTFQRTALGLGQVLSSLAIGYGMHRYSIGGMDRSFYSMLQNVDLSPEQKWQLFLNFKKEKEYQEYQLNKIKMTTFLILGLTDILVASQEKNKETQKIFYALGGVQLFFCWNFSQ